MHMPGKPNLNVQALSTCPPQCIEQSLDYTLKIMSMHPCDKDCSHQETLEVIKAN